MAALLVAAAVLLPVSRTLAAEAVSFHMDWVIGGKHTLFFPAADLGHYKNEGLDVKIELKCSRTDPASGVKGAPGQG